MLVEDSGKLKIQKAAREIQFLEKCLGLVKRKPWGILKLCEIRATEPFFLQKKL